MSQTLQRPLWGGKPIKGGDLWTLRKAKGDTERVAVCELWWHQLGWELRLLAAGELLRSQVCRAFNEWLGVADEWRAAMIEKGWS